MIIAYYIINTYYQYLLLIGKDEVFMLNICNRGKL